MNAAVIVNGIPWTVGAIVPSLAPESTTLYVVGQCRFMVSGATAHIRLQYPWFELTGPISAKLGTWGALLPTPWKSMHSGSVVYVPIQARPDVDGMRVRIPGPTPYNRPYGAAVVLTAAALTGLVRYLTVTLDKGA